MTELKELLDHRKNMKKKKPVFVRQEFNKRKRLSNTWRRPRGIHSKLRLRRRGKPARVSIGYGTSKKVKHLTLEGLKKIVISNLSELKSLKKDEIAIISRTVGAKKRLEILKEAQKSNIKIHNVSDIKKAIENIHKKREEKKKQKQAKKEKSKKKDKKSKEKPKEEKKPETKEKPKEEKKPETKEKPKEEKKPETKEKPKEEKKPETKEKPKEETKNNVQKSEDKEVKDEPKTSEKVSE